MIDPYVKARCALFGVLQNISYLMEHDEESKKIIGDKKIAIQFNVKNGPKGNLSFADGKAEMKEGKHKSDILLYFTSPQHFNKMIDGKANPIPLKGFTQIKFLTGPFQNLTKRLEYYLKPTPENLKDAEFFKRNTEMTAYTAFFSLAEIANYDTNAASLAKYIPDGDILVEIKNGPAITATAKKGKLIVSKGKTSQPRSVLGFDGIRTAHGILNNTLDSFTALGMGKMTMKGFIPMVENLNPILDKVEAYLL